MGLIKAILFLNYRGVGMSKEKVFKAAKALAEKKKAISLRGNLG